MNLSTIKNIFLKLLTFLKFVKTKVIIIMILIGFTYQAIDITVEYLKYETVVSIGTDSGEENLPAISLCIKSEKSYSEFNRMKVGNETISDLICRGIIQRLNNGKYIGNCGEKFTVVESVTPIAKKCFTFYSSLIENRHLMRANKTIGIIFLRAFKLYLNCT